MSVKTPTTPQATLPQTGGLAVRTDLRAGESVEACQRNLDYWKKTYDQNCRYYY